MNDILVTYPIAKSLLCVQNIAKSPALPKLSGRTTSSVINKTAIKTIALDMSIDKRKVQLTVLQFSSARDKKISEGSAKLPTKVFKPLLSVFEIIFKRPAR